MQRSTYWLVHHRRNHKPHSFAVLLGIGCVCTRVRGAHAARGCYVQRQSAKGTLVSADESTATERTAITPRNCATCSNDTAFGVHFCLLLHVHSRPAYQLANPTASVIVTTTAAYKHIRFYLVFIVPLSTLYVCARVFDSMPGIYRMDVLMCRQALRGVTCL